MPNITMTYGSGVSPYSFSPVPLISINKVNQKRADGKIIGTVYNCTLEGTLYEPTGGISNVMQWQDDLKAAFAIEGQLFRVKCDSTVLLNVYPRVSNLSFPPSSNNWVQTSAYTLELEFDDEPQPSGSAGSQSLGENSSIMPPFIEDFKESWNLEQITDTSKYSLTLPGSILDTNIYALRLTHNVSAVGKRRYTYAGLDKEAWQQAQDYVIPKLGYDSSFLASSGVLNINTTPYFVCNHSRTNQTDVDGGFFGVVETFTLANTGDGIAGYAIEDFTVDVRTGIDIGLATVTVQGSIQGLELVNYGTSPGDFSITQTKYTSASGYWANVKTKIQPRAQLYYSQLPGVVRSIHTTPVSQTVGHNLTNGVITYNYEFNDRPYNCVTNALTESITVTDSNPTDIFAEIPILGRTAGPILQDMGTVSSRKREISVDVIMQPSTGCTPLLMWNTNPRTSVDALINGFYTELTGVYSQVFKHIDTENWEPKIGHYSRQVGYTFGDCT